MVNGVLYCRALESVSIASALSSALTIYPCQIRVHVTLTVLNSNFLQLGKQEWWPATADSLPKAVIGYLSTAIHTTLAGIEPTTFRLLVRRAIPVGLTRPHRRYQQLGICGRCLRDQSLREICTDEATG